MNSWPSKDPEEVLDYQFDWTARLAEGETIAASTFVLASGDVTLGSAAEADGITTVWIEGGTLGTAAVITNRIETSAGRTYDESARLRVRTH